MTLKECYTALGGDYDEVLGRLRSERLVQKFTLKFLDDGSFELLCKSMEDGAYEDAFRAAHTIKGMCQNLGFTALGKTSSELSEALRNGYTPQADGLLEQVREDYRRTAQAIRTFREGIEG